ncbi:2-dehydropantoate 2-reductase [Vibrio fluvialis]|nr:2-dehydropantoate 2-reductase [Vibrio fluvialis]
MNIVVVGPGAVGSLWAYSLQQAGHRVSLWGTQDTSHWALQLNEAPSIDFAYNQPDTLRHADLLLITVKAWQVESALQPLLPLIEQETILLFMHNGMGALDNLADRLRTFPALLATTTHGALKTSAHTVKHTGLGHTQLGAFNPLGAQCEFIAEVLNHALPSVAWNMHIEQALWQKLAVNCAINPLTAIHHITNGELALPQYRQTLDSIVTEVVSVMQAEHMPVDLAALRATVDNVIHATAANRSSMHQDIFHRRRTEIDFITGYVVRKAQQHRLAVPANLALYQHIQSIEQSWTQS